MTEAAGTRQTETYTVELASQPTSSVTVNITSNDSTVATVSPSSVAFSESNWNETRLVTVRGIDDALVNNPDRTTTIDHVATGGDYDGLTAALDVTVVDDEEIPVEPEPSEMTLSVTNANVNEDVGNVTVTVTLDRETQTEIEVTLAVNETSTAIGGGVDYTLSNMTLTIPDGKRSITTTLTVIDDQLDEDNESILLNARSVSPALKAKQIEITIEDNDTAQVLVSPLALTIDEGSSGTYSVKLATKPFENVVVKPASADKSIATVSDAMTFTPADWNTAQESTVDGVPDDDFRDDTTLIHHTVTGYGAITTASSVEINVIEDEVPRVIVEPETLTVPEGSSVAYSVRLSSKPEETVTVTPTSGDTNLVTTSGRLTFNQSNWFTVQLITVYALNDDDGENNMVSISHGVSGYGTVTSAPNVLATIIDDDVPGVVITPTAVHMMEGQTGQYSVRLATRPSGSVKVLCKVEDQDVAHVGPIGFMIFTREDWNITKQVTVFSVVDEDAIPEATRISHPVVGYNGVERAEEVTVDVNEVGPTVMDPISDLRIIIEPTTLSIREGSSESYTVRLSESPEAMLTISPSVHEMSVATVRGHITFNESNWAEPQRITVYGQHDDDHVNDGTTIRHKAILNDVELDVSDVTVLVEDDDIPAVVVHPTEIDLEPGESASYEISLATRPQSAMQVGLDYTSSAHFRVVSDRVLTFNLENWYVKRSVMVEGLKSRIVATRHSMSIGHIVMNYGGIRRADSVDITMSAKVDVEVGAIVTPAHLVLDEGTSRRYAVVLDAQPIYDTTVIPIHQAEQHLSTPRALVFTPSNWNVRQIVTISAGHDPDARDHEVLISHDITSNGTTRRGPSVVVSIRDDDAREVLISTDAIRMPEGSSESYTIVLATEPSSEVVVTAMSDNSSVIDTFEHLRFAPTNWNIPQTVIVSSVIDGDALDEEAVIHHSVTGYGEVTTAAPVNVRVYDKNVAEVIIAPTLVRLVEGDSTEYTVVLGSQPTNSVEITPTSANPELVQVGNGVKFTSQNWSVPQNVAIRASEDQGNVNEHVTIQHAVSGYGSITLAPSVTVSLQDNDIVASEFALSKVAGTVADQSVFAISKRGKPESSTSNLIQSVSNTLGHRINENGRDYNHDRQPTSIAFDLDSPICPSALSVSDDTDSEQTPSWFCRYPVSVWGSGDYQSVSDSLDLERFDGRLSTFNLGVDVSLSDAWLVGLLASTSQVRADVIELVSSHQYDFDLSSFYLYAKAFYPRFEGWATTGQGTGTLDIRLPSSRLSYSSSLETSTSAIGGRATVTQFRSFDINVKGETIWTSLSVLGTDLEGSGIVESEVDTTRSRLSLEASKHVRLPGDRGSLVPEVELGLRHDGDSTAGGDNTLIELVTGFGYRSTSGRVKLSSHVNYSNRTRKDGWGGNIQFEIEPFNDGQGFSFRLRPIYGVELTSITDLWRESPTFEQSTSNLYRANVGYRVQSFIGYGLARHHGVLTPYISTETQAATRSSRLGILWNTWWHDLLFKLYLEDVSRPGAISNDSGLNVEFQIRL